LPGRSAGFGLQNLAQSKPVNRWTQLPWPALTPSVMKSSMDRSPGSSQTRLAMRWLFSQSFQSLRAARFEGEHRTRPQAQSMAED
jgi:hypothetical protein